jgi:hypothetical protein
MLILEIEEAWHKFPGWFDTLDRADKARLIARHRIQRESKKGSPGGRRFRKNVKVSSRKAADFWFGGSGS